MDIDFKKWGDTGSPMRQEEVRLIESIKMNLDGLKALQASADEMFGAEDLIYRYYHTSFKVYRIQTITQQIVAALSALAENRPLNERFLSIVEEGAAKRFTNSVNQNWDPETRPMLEAYFHARYFLDMVIKYGQELSEPPSTLPSGWAAVLYLYNMR